MDQKKLEKFMDDSDLSDLVYRYFAVRVMLCSISRSDDAVRLGFAGKMTNDTYANEAALLVVADQLQKVNRQIFNDTTVQADS